MSADYWLEMDTGGEEKSRLTDSINCTYNLRTMLREAGWPATPNGGTDWQWLIGRTASDSIDMLAAVSAELHARPEHYAQWNAGNGWGDVAWCTEFVGELLKHALANPRAVWGGWL